MPLTRRIYLALGLNGIVFAVLVLVAWRGGPLVESYLDELASLQRRGEALTKLDVETSQLQLLIRQYLADPDEATLADIGKRAAELIRQQQESTATARLPAADAANLASATQRFVAGFHALQAQNADLVATYEQEVLRPSREASGLFAILNGSLLASGHGTLLAPALGKAYEAFVEALLNLNAYYLQPEEDTAERAAASLSRISGVIPVMVDLARSDLQRQSVQALGERAAMLQTGLAKMRRMYARRAALLAAEVDGSQRELSALAQRILNNWHAEAEAIRGSYARRLHWATWTMLAAVLLVVALAGVASWVLAQSLRRPLARLMDAVGAFAAGDLRHDITDREFRDEIGTLARTLDAFKAHELKRRETEAALVAAREELMQAEKLASLGQLVAGVAHEINTPIGVALTAATTLQHRTSAFAELVAGGAVKKSDAAKFIQAAEGSTQVVVTNIERAAALVQSFKRVAVDRASEERRNFELGSYVDEVVRSLEPAMKRSPHHLRIECPKPVHCDSYPGAVAQIVTNLVMNSLTHAFSPGRLGTIVIAVDSPADGQAQLRYRDNGCGIPAEHLGRIFDPFFTTRRSSGGTGLGLHIVHGLATQTLGGSIAVGTPPDGGVEFTVLMPRVAPAAEAGGVG